MERMHERLPEAQWLWVEDAGHAGLVEAGTEIAEAVRAFRESCGVGPAYPGPTPAQTRTLPAQQPSGTPSP